MTPSTVAHYAPLSMGFPREWVAISFSRGFADPGIKPMSFALQVDSLPLSHLGSPQWNITQPLKRNEFEAAVVR